MYNVYPGTTPIFYNGAKNPLTEIPASRPTNGKRDPRFGVHKAGVVKETALGSSVVKIVNKPAEHKKSKPATQETAPAEAKAEEVKSVEPVVVAEKKTTKRTSKKNTEE